MLLQHILAEHAAGNIHNLARRMTKSLPHTSNPVILTTSYLGFPFGFFLPWLLSDCRCRRLSRNRSLCSFCMFAMHPQNHLSHIIRCKQRGNYEVCECLTLLRTFRSDHWFRNTGSHSRLPAFIVEPNSVAYTSAVYAVHIQPRHCLIINAKHRGRR